MLTTITPVNIDSTAKFSIGELTPGLKEKIQLNLDEEYLQIGTTQTFGMMKNRFSAWLHLN